MPAISVVYGKEASVTAGCFRRNRLEAFTDGKAAVGETHAEFPRHVQP